ncbi:uncharacterized protein LOC132940793 [Metopolophium dirhodum]|uniref:uncharacterized protein LOC132940793 n=1 Tax=Metopolophium dirhodum TaxID=44670 RepID=UPI00298F5A68|nr:uncharacterized protein LOC132940793 [Metopolophium dirhodum]
MLYKFNLYERNERSRSRSPISGMKNNEEGAQASRRIPGLRGHMVYADPLGYTYVQNNVLTNRRQLRSSRYEQGCRSTASMSLYPVNAPIVMYCGHDHHYGLDIEIGAFIQ